MKRTAGIVIHEEDFDLFNDIGNPEEVGRLILSLIRYARDGTVEPIGDRGLDLIAGTLRRAYDKDREQYEETCRRNRVNAAKRWQALKDVEEAPKTPKPKGHHPIRLYAEGDE
jgi:hypothetical protein